MGRRLLGIEARSAAAWVAVAAAFACGWLVTRLAADGFPFLAAVAIACGGLLACAASGDSPRGLAEREAWTAAVRLVRLAWPLTGCLVGILAGFVRAGSEAGLPPGAGRGVVLAATLLPASLVGTGVAVGVATAAVGPVAALGIGLALAGAAAATALMVAMAISPAVLPQAVAALAAWMLLAAGSRAAGQDLAGERGSRAGERRGWPAGMFAMPQGLVAAALGTSLVAMAGCYFLAPQAAWLYAVLSAGWLLVLVVPPVTAAEGGLFGVRLVRAAAGRGPLPGSLGRAGRLTASALAFLGWPAIVPLLLPAAEGPRSGGPLVAVGCLAAAAGLILAVAAAAGRRGRLARAVVFALASVAVAAAGIADPIGVEPWRRSCQTSQSSQPVRFVAGPPLLPTRCRELPPRRPITVLCVVQIMTISPVFPGASPWLDPL